MNIASTALWMADIFNFGPLRLVFACFADKAPELAFHLGD